MPWRPKVLHKVMELLLTSERKLSISRGKARLWEVLPSLPCRSLLDG